MISEYVNKNYTVNNPHWIDYCDFRILKGFKNITSSLLIFFLGPLEIM